MCSVKNRELVQIILKFHKGSALTRASTEYDSFLEKVILASKNRQK